MNQKTYHAIKMLVLPNVEDTTVSKTSWKAVEPGNCQLNQNITSKNSYSRQSEEGKHSHQ